MAQNIFVMIQNCLGHIEGKDIRILPCPSISPKQFWTSLHCFGTDPKLIFNLDMVWKVKFSCENMLLDLVQIENLFWTSPKCFGPLEGQVIRISSLNSGLQRKFSLISPFNQPAAAAGNKVLQDSPDSPRICWKLQLIPSQQRPRLLPSR